MEAPAVWRSQGGASDREPDRGQPGDSWPPPARL